ncbi:hypothetical protein GCM10027436_02900 [Actinophytocola sediminis]
MWAEMASGVAFDRMEHAGVVPWCAHVAGRVVVQGGDSDLGDGVAGVVEQSEDLGVEGQVGIGHARQDRTKG